MDVLLDIVGFAGKGLIVVIAVAACAAIVLSLIRPSRRAASRDGRLVIRRLNDSMRRAADALQAAALPPKESKRRSKALAKARKKEQRPSRNVFVLDFKGDILASAVDSLRQEVSALLAAAGKDDEVVLRLDSPGGTVPNYGLAASQLDRLKQGGLQLTVCVDKVAASGGYLMACVADQILAAPFAVVGSIGVVAPLPNLHRLLERHGVDYENLTAGEHKRSVSFLAKIDEAGRRKYQEQLDETHALFKGFVHEHRPDLDVEQVATGDYWHGTRALELGLVNRLMTSADYLMSKLDEANLLHLAFQRPRSLRDRVAGAAGQISAQIADRLWARALQEPRP